MLRTFGVALIKALATGRRLLWRFDGASAGAKQNEANAIDERIVRGLGIIWGLYGDSREIIWGLYGDHGHFKDWNYNPLFQRAKYA